jgi:hypothetical protein
VDHVANPAHDALAQEAHEEHEDHAQHQLPGSAELEGALEEILEEEPHGGSDQRAHERAAAADDGLHHQLAGGVEGEGIGRHEGLHDAEEPAGEAGIGRGDDERRELVAVDVVADGGRAQRILADRAEDRPDGRAHDPQRDHHAKEEAEGEKRVERPSCRERELQEAEVDRRRRHAREPVLPARPFRQRIEFDEVEDLGDRHRDHREVDAGAPQRDQPHEVAHRRGRDHADHERGDHVRKSGAREQVRGDHPPGAVQRGLAEGKQPV